MLTRVWMPHSVCVECTKRPVRSDSCGYTGTVVCVSPKLLKTNECAAGGVPAISAGVARQKGLPRSLRVQGSPGRWRCLGSIHAPERNT